MAPSWRTAEMISCIIANDVEITKARSANSSVIGRRPRIRSRALEFRTSESPKSPLTASQSHLAYCSWKGLLSPSFPRSRSMSSSVNSGGRDQLLHDHVARHEAHE